MAAPDFNPAQKPYTYDLLGRLNAAFARVTRHMSQLEQVGIFDKRVMIRLYRMSKELQASANYHLLETLQDCEERDWARYGRRRQAVTEQTE
ncbi:MAG TPA: hypothetical protein VNW97_22465 [Candidatus Saccharimonadales bacterium]|jgi:hypothetical protein|nr:hypothetical protein [Candidatus Saccharimonadales bacterium]